LFFYVCQGQHVRQLLEAGRAIAEGTQPTCAYADNVAQSIGWEMACVFR
jgi:hypothetical protein